MFVPPPKPTNLGKTERKKILVGLFSDYGVRRSSHHIIHVSEHRELWSYHSVIQMHMIYHIFDKFKAYLWCFLPAEYHTKFSTGRLRYEVQPPPWPFAHHFDTKGTLSYTFN